MSVFVPKSTRLLFLTRNPPLRGFFCAWKMESPYMPEPAQTTIFAAAGSAIGAAVLGIGRWMLRRQVERIDKHDEQINELQQSSITKGDLQEVKNAINQGNAEIQRTLGAAHNRIDQLYRDMPKRAD